MRARSSRRARAMCSRREIAEPLGHGRRERPRTRSSTIANEHMVGAIRDITINEGLDPRGLADRRRRRRRRHDDRAHRRGARLRPGAGAADRRPLCRRAAACSPTSSPSSASAGVPTRTASTPTAVNAGLAQLARADRRVLRRGSRPPAERAGGVLRRGALPVPGLGARGAACATAGSRPRPTSRTMVRGLPRRARARLRGQRAGPARRVHLLEGPGDRAPRQAGARRARASTGRARPSRLAARDAWFGARDAAETPCFLGASLLGRHERRRAGDRRGADDDRRRLPGLVADVTDTGDYLLTPTGDAGPMTRGRTNRSTRSCSRCSRTGSRASAAR